MDKAKAAQVEPVSTKIIRWLKRGVHLGGFAALLWSYSIWKMVQVLNGPIPKVREVASSIDFESLVFGASSTALIIYSVVIGVVAFFGYDYLRRDTAATVQTALQERMDKLEKEMRGRMSASIGLSLGIIHESRRQEEENRIGYLKESVAHSTAAYEALREVGGKGQYMALNNLVYYACELHRPEDREDLLKKAEELREFSQNNLPVPYWEGVLTYCRAITDLDGDESQTKRAYYIASGLLTEALNERQKEEAAMYAAVLKRKLGKEMES